MSTAKYIGRVGALAIALGVGLAAMSAPEVASAEQSDSTSADSTALLVCFQTCTTFNDAHVEAIKNQIIAPTHPGQDIDYVLLTTPGEVWPLTGVFRVVQALGFADSGCPNPAGDCRPDFWPDYPLWKLSGLFDLTYDQSVQVGVADLEAAMAAAGNDHLVIYGDDQGANVANAMKRKLAEQYPTGTPAPDIDFATTGSPNVPNGGLHARFPGLFVPYGWTFDGPEPTNTQFHTDVIIRQYDGITDFPLYPLNVIATANALLGVFYVHPFPFDVSLAPDPTGIPATVSQYGDTTYHFFKTKDLPLFGPLRTLGVPESLIDVVEPFFRVLVELGYDRSISPGEPTPARLIPPLDPAKVITDLVNAIPEGINNGATVVGLPPAPNIPAPVTLAASATETKKSDMSPQVMTKDRPTQTEQAMSSDTSTTLTETARADASRPGAPTELVNATDPPTSAQATTDTEQRTSPTPKPAKPAGEPSKPRPVVPDSLRAGKQLPVPSHRGAGHQPNARTGDVGAEAATGEPSSTASSSPTSSSAGSSSGGGTSGSESDGS